MIIKGRSPTMRHVSRNHREALDWLFDRINLDPKIQIKYVDTTNQLAEMLTTGSFTRDEWDHLLRLLNIMNFSMFHCSHVLSNRKQSVMSKRVHESTAKEGSAVAKPTPMCLVSRNNLSAKKNPPQDSSVLNSLGNQELDQSYVSPSCLGSTSGASEPRGSDLDERSLSEEPKEVARGQWLQFGRECVWGARRFVVVEFFPRSLLWVMVLGILLKSRRSTKQVSWDTLCYSVLGSEATA